MTDNSERKIITPEMAAQEILFRNSARDNLIDFARYQQKTYEADPFHYLLAEYLEKVERGEIDRLMINTPPRFGKLCADDTCVYTPNGWRKHGDLKAGDLVFSPSGKSISITAVSDKSNADIRVEMTNGEVIYCHENHEWTVYDRCRHAWRTVETKFFMKVDKGYRKGQTRSIWAGERAQFQLPEIKALETEEIDLPLHPYALGAWLGDGTSKSSCITHAKSDSGVVTKIESLGYKVSCFHTHATTGVITTSFAGKSGGKGGALWLGLKAAGVNGNKHIPELYKISSIDQKLELMAGLIDTDGHSCKKTGRVRISTVSETLANDIADVTRSLGWRTYIVKVKPATSSSGIVGTKAVYQVGFNPNRDFPVALERKKILRFPVDRKIGIKSVTYDPQGHLGHCIQVDSEDGLYLVGRQMVATHNSELASIKFPAWFMARNPNHNVIQASYNLEQATRSSRFTRDIIEGDIFQNVFPEIKMSAQSRAADRWMLDNGQEYFGVGVGTGATGKGGHCLVGSTNIVTRSGQMTIQSFVGSGGNGEVLSYDHGSDQVVWRSCQAVSERFVKGVYEVSFSNGSTICSSSEHPFYLNGDYVLAKDVQVGQVGIRFVNGITEKVTVTNCIYCSGETFVYNIQVEGTENFFADEILTHNCIIIDDPYKDSEECDSPTIREKVWDWYNSVILTRLERGGRLIIIQTRWHYDDLSGRLLAAEKKGGDKWTVLKLPALCTDPENDLLGRQLGESLSPGRRTVAELERIKRGITQRFWSAMFQQEPISEEGAMFQARWFDTAEKIPVGMKRVRAWDFGSTTAGDYTVGVLMSRDQDGIFYIEDVVRDRITPFNVERLVMETAEHDRKKYGSVQILIPQDPGQAGVAQAQSYIRRMAGFRIKAVRPTGDKETRASGLAAQAEAKMVKLKVGPWNKDFTEELSLFPFGAHDDQVDAAADAFNGLLGPGRARILDW